jgi:hypothetical protein
MIAPKTACGKKTASAKCNTAVYTECLAVVELRVFFIHLILKSPEILDHVF